MKLSYKILIAFFSLLLVAFTSLFFCRDKWIVTYLENRILAKPLAVKLSGLESHFFPFRLQIDHVLVSNQDKAVLNLEKLHIKLPLFSLIRKQLLINTLSIGELSFENPNFDWGTLEQYSTKIFQPIAEPSIENEYQTIEAAFDKIRKEWQPQLAIQKSRFKKEARALAARYYQNESERQHSQSEFKKKVLIAEQYYLDHLQLLNQEFQQLALKIEKKEQEWLSAYESKIPWAKTDLWLNKSIKELLKKFLSQLHSIVLYTKQESFPVVTLENAALKINWMGTLYQVKLENFSNQSKKSDEKFQLKINSLERDQVIDLKIYEDSYKNLQINVMIDSLPYATDSFSIHLAKLRLDLNLDDKLERKQGSIQLNCTEWVLTKTSFVEQFFIPKDFYISLNFFEDAGDLNLSMQSDLNQWLRSAWVKFYLMQRNDMKKSFEKKAVHLFESWQKEFNKDSRQHYRLVKDSFRELYTAF